MGILSIVGLLAAVASVNAGVCPAGQKPVVPAGPDHAVPSGGSHGSYGDVVGSADANNYGNFPWSNPNGPGAGSSAADAPKSPSEAPDASLSTSEDAKNNPNLPNSAEHRGNWLPGFDINTDYSTSWPNTGNVVQATFTITNGSWAPDGGAPQEMYLINGQFPGPLLEGNWGDTFEVTVINELQNNGTGIHWHGFRQFNNNANDGVPGLTECPIAPGGQKVYRFQATGYGSTWYHSHFSTQYGAGVLGPIVVHGPASANYDIDLGSVQVSDFYEQTVWQVDYLAHLNGAQTADNYIVNGMNSKPDGSGGERAQFKFTPGKKHLMRFVNTAVDGLFKIQLDGHKLLVIANDNTPIVPYYTTELSIGIGERYDVVIEADQSASAYYLRTIPAPGCALNKNNGLGTANAIVVYDGASSTTPTTSAPPTIGNPACVDEPLASLVPIVTAAVDGSNFASQFAPLPVGVKVATLSSNERVFLWYINGISQDIDWTKPTIGEVTNNANIASAGAGVGALLPQEWNVQTLPNKGEWTFWVIQNQFFVPHPMHLHGHDFAVLGQGAGNFDAGSMLGSLNFKNPTRRDTVQLPGSGWAVIAFQADNPGAWLMHCHIAFHVSEGLSLEFVELPSEMPTAYGEQCGAGSVFAQQCEAWTGYEAGAVYQKQGSGLKTRRGWTQNEHKREAENMEEAKMGMLMEQMVKRAL